MSSAVSPSTTSKQKPLSKLVPPERLSSLPYTSPSERCASCGQTGVQLREVTRSFGHGPNLLVIESIPMWSCPHCGESYFTAQTMHEIERIKTLRKSVAVARHVPVAVFTGNVPNNALHRTRQKAARR
ncbi:MAG: type II toxin-antitoxin system MqsA family antitoxin [Chromatiales bacterium]